jgi:hypothetical protein
MQERAGWTREQCMDKLRDNTAAAIEAIQAVPDAQLEEPVAVPMGDGEMSLLLGAWVLMVYRTFISRFAQINYIQTLYGDFDFH